MTDAPSEGIVVDTMVISWLFDERPNPLANRYRALIGRRSVLLAFQTVMELRYGALRANWGELRRRRLERRIAELTIIEGDDEMTTRCAELRNECQRVGHALADKVHDGDRWVAAAALRLKVPLASHDGVFALAPRLELITARALATRSDEGDL
jgi:predicted nucleic acid-binding protein